MSSPSGCGCPHQVDKGETRQLKINCIKQLLDVYVRAYVCVALPTILTCKYRRCPHKTDDEKHCWRQQQLGPVACNQRRDLSSGAAGVRRSPILAPRGGAV